MRRIPVGRRMNAAEAKGGGERDEGELAELDRLRSASLLSAGLAHEVANPLLGVLTNIAEIERIYPRLRALMGPAHAERWEALADFVHEAHRSADVIADVIRDFQAFLRPADNRVSRLVDPGPLVERAIRMTSPRLKVTASFRSCLDKTPPVKAPPGAITQIALNLLTNAIEALAEADPKRSFIRVRLATEGANVVLEVEDNGPGLAPAAAKAAFEPHVTSKGSSLGLGLSISRALVERLGGTIAVSSVPNERTCFRVTLPAADAA
ncbi:MAG TPA: HAMP domain-containing sensor histidine kinase [Polyangiaceae bacterium]